MDDPKITGYEKLHSIDTSQRRAAAEMFAAAILMNEKAEAMMATALAVRALLARQRAA